MKAYGERQQKEKEDSEERVPYPQVQLKYNYIDKNKRELEESNKKSKRALEDSINPDGYSRLDEDIVSTACLCDPRYEQRFGGDGEYFQNRKSKSNIVNNSSVNKSSFSNISGISNQLKTLYNFYNVRKNHGYFEVKNTSPKMNSNNINEYECKYSKNYRSNYKEYDYNYNGNIKNIRNIRNIRNSPHKEANYDYEKTEKYGKRYINYTPIEGGRIENYIDNEMSKDGRYLISTTLAKKVMDKNEIENREEEYEEEEVCEEEEEEEEEEEGGEEENEDEKRDINYNKEEMDIEENENELKEYEETNRILNKKVKDLGDNYKYYERNETKSPLKKSETVQKRREPYNVKKNEYYYTEEKVKK